MVRLTTLCIMTFIFLTQNIAHAERTLRLATTTSTENSGLLAYLLPDFEKKTGHKIHVIAVGTGKALRMGRDGDVDVLLVHAPNAETQFIAEGYGIERISVMHNDFVIVGPQADPAKLSDSKSLIETMKHIASTKSPFVSRGDDSGTHKKELGLWTLANIKPEGRWYREAGQGMGKVLQIAGEMDAYTMTDRGTWLAYQDKSPLKIVFEGDNELFNPYHIIAISVKKYPELNHKVANDLINWITSADTQKMIGDFRLHGQQLFTPSAKLKKEDNKLNKKK